MSSTITPNVPRYDSSLCFSKPLDDTKEYSPFEGRATSNIPFTVSMVFFPFLLYQMIQGIKTAHRIGDPENIAEASASTFTAVLNLVTSSLLSAPIRYEAPYISFEGVHSLFIGGVYLGIALCAIEGGLEIKALHSNHKRTKQFLINPLMKLKKNKNSSREKKLEVLREVHKEVKAQFQSLSKAFPSDQWKEFEDQFTFSMKEIEIMPSKIEKTYDELYRILLGTSMSYLKDRYFQVNPKELKCITDKVRAKWPNANVQQFQIKQIEEATKLLRQKKCRLSRAISPWAVQQIDKHLEPTIQHLTSDDPELQKKGIEQAEKLVSTINDQLDKKYVIHWFGLGCVTFIGIGLVGILCHFPPILIISLIALGCALLIPRYICAESVLNHPGWGINGKQLIPNWLRFIFRINPLPNVEIIEEEKALPLLQERTPFYLLSQKV